MPVNAQSVQDWSLDVLFYNFVSNTDTVVSKNAWVQESNPSDITLDSTFIIAQTSSAIIL